ncbi:FliM/FliN family flagellar motor switch protein [Marinobacterium sp. D7]|uniref:FliM/FliN family flagellar motor switch protein n=1 Tax=Marinobacterium ramblicola TaxID=2849041 RepID=UPI001C2CEAB7|nr:FliM/FliN family flagellar motor switch protein [Marinobacterium ramblicola]MBV1787716.1 FliM/FliN family flagellar motor switch protein [Marinobacterium ramblicola]
MNNIEALTFEELEVGKESGPAIIGKNFDIIKDVKVKVDIKLGDSEITVNELMNISKGSVVQLSQKITEPLELILDGNVVARGELVAAGDNFGIKIVEVKEINGSA